MSRKDPAKLKKVSVNLPFGMGGAEWEADSTERRAAWALYVELATRVAVEPLGPEEGFDREALNSLYSLFETTRQVLRDSGPDVGAAPKSVGGVAIAVLNRGLRPFLSKWHVALRRWEREQGRVETQEVELWPERAQFRKELTDLQQHLVKYTDALATIAGVRRADEYPVAN